jgi:hypothetical protein
MEDPVNNSERALAARFHISIKRVDAILRLKGLELDWMKVSQIFLVEYTSRLSKA